LGQLLAQHRFGVLGAHKAHPHEKQTRGQVAVLGGLFNIASALEQKT